MSAQDCSPTTVGAQRRFQDTAERLARSVGVTNPTDVKLIEATITLEVSRAAHRWRSRIESMLTHSLQKEGVA